MVLDLMFVALHLNVIVDFGWFRAALRVGEGWGGWLIWVCWMVLFVCV